MKSLALQMLFRFVECFEKRLHTNQFHVIFGFAYANFKSHFFHCYCSFSLILIELKSKVKKKNKVPTENENFIKCQQHIDVVRFDFLLQQACLMLVCLIFLECHGEKIGSHGNCKVVCSESFPGLHVGNDLGSNLKKKYGNVCLVYRKNTNNI